MRRWIDPIRLLSVEAADVAQVEKRFERPLFEMTPIQQYRRLCKWVVKYVSDKKLREPRCLCIELRKPRVVLSAKNLRDSTAYSNGHRLIAAPRKAKRGNRMSVENAVANVMLARLALTAVLKNRGPAI